MADRGGRRRQGLEGLPVNADEVWAFDAVRSSMRGGDRGALVLIWAGSIGLIWLAVWGGSVILGVLGAVALALALWWTLTKWRSRRDAERQMRRAAAREAP
jgi:hypothetical protein